MSEQEVDIYVVYDHPTDFPDEYVVRQWYVGKEGVYCDLEPLVKNTDLSFVQNYLMEMGLHKLHRFPDDDEKILETWL